MKTEMIPQKFNPMIQMWDTDVIGTVEIEFLIPSGQMWNNLTEKEQKKLRDLVIKHGGDMDDLLDRMNKMLPRSPRE